MVSQLAIIAESDILLKLHISVALRGGPKGAGGGGPL